MTTLANQTTLFSWTFLENLRATAAYQPVVVRNPRPLGLRGLRLPRGVSLCTTSVIVHL